MTDDYTNHEALANHVRRLLEFSHFGGSIECYMPEGDAEEWAKKAAAMLGVGPNIIGSRVDEATSEGKK